MSITDGTGGFKDVVIKQLPVARYSVAVGLSQRAFTSTISSLSLKDLKS